MGMRLKLMITLLLFAVVPTIIVTVIEMERVRHTLEQQVGTSSLELARLSLRRISEHLYSKFEEVQGWSRDVCYTEYAKADDQAGISERLVQDVQASGDYHYAMILDASGKVIACSDEKLLGRQLADDPGFRKALDGEPSFQDVALNPLSEAHDIVISFPIKSRQSNGEIQGVVSAALKWDQVNSSINEVKIEGRPQTLANHFMMTNRDGLVISCHMRHSLFKVNLSKAGMKSALNALEQKEGFLLETSEHGVPSFTAYTYMRKYKDLPELGWCLVLLQDPNRVFAPVDSLRRTALSVLVVVTAVLVLVSFLFARRMAKPIVKVAAAADAVARGDLSIRVPVTSKDEIGALSAAFNHMVDRLAHADEELRRSEHKYRALFETAGDAIFTVQITPAGPRFVDCNLAVHKIFGYTHQEIIGKSPLDLSPSVQPDGTSSAARIEQIVDAALAGESQAFEWVHRRRDGSRFDAEVNLNRVFLGAEAFLQATVRDVTERKRVAEMLRLIVKGTATATGKKFFRSMAQHLGTALGMRYAYVGELLHAPQKRIRSVALWADGRFADNVEYDLARTPCEKVVGQEICLYEKEVQKHFPEDTLLTEMEAESYMGMPLFDHAGKPLGLLVVMDNRPLPQRMIADARSLLTIFAARAAAELQRVRAEMEREKLIARLEAQNTELERFTYTVSHDLKTPLITLKGFVGLLQDKVVLGDDEAVDEALARMSNAADTMWQLLNELLELSRIGRVVNPPEEVPLDELVREAVELVGGRISQDGVRVQIAPDLPVVFGDRQRLLEVMQNLVDNAVKYMGDQPHPCVEIGVRSENHETVCYVHDNGIGVEPAYHEKIFGLFNQLDPNVEGTGIGLALAKRIVEVHGGSIWVESESPGMGSTFCFTCQLAGGTN